MSPVTRKLMWFLLGLAYGWILRDQVKEPAASLHSVPPAHDVRRCWRCGSPGHYVEQCPVPMPSGRAVR